MIACSSLKPLSAAANRRNHCNHENFRGCTAPGWDAIQIPKTSTATGVDMPGFWRVRHRGAFQGNQRDHRIHPLRVSSIPPTLHKQDANIEPLRPTPCAVPCVYASHHHKATPKKRHTLLTPIVLPITENSRSGPV